MKTSKILFLLILILSSVHIHANTPEPPAVLKGRVLDETGQPLVGATVYIKGTNIGCTTNNEGHFLLKRVPGRHIDVVVSYLGYITQEQKADLTRRREAILNFNLEVESNLLSTVEVFGERHKQPDKLDAITRMPLRPNEQIQSISVISNKMIEEQGAMSVTDAVRNVPGVTLFGSYGGVRESMSTRGYRGVPILKNGVRVDSDFRTGSALSEMSGIESVQVIKGSAAITQGIGNDLGSGGGVINVVTKTPKFVNGGEVSLRSGSWGEVRPAFDVQTILDKNQTVGFRLNGMYRRSDNYRPVVKNERLYVNPSLEWRPDEKTTVTLEMDYMDDNSTPFTSTVNLSADTEENLYDMPHSKFLGTRNDNVNTRTMTYAARITRALSSHVSLRAAYFSAKNETDNTTTSAKAIKGEPYNMRQRSISRSTRNDKNSTFQLDLIGRDVYTGPIKHTFQLGFDYKTTDLTTQAFGANAKGDGVVIDIIDVLADEIPNPTVDVKFLALDPVHTESSSYGIMAQEVMTVNQYLKAILGLRYSSISTPAVATEAGRTRGDAWNPMVGVMVTPIRNINVFASFTNTTSLRSAADLRSEEYGGGTVGPSKTNQWEIGFKSEWLNERLRFNFTYFDIITENLSFTEYFEGTTTPTGFKGIAGDLKRKGIETELSGRILENLQVILGYAYLKAEYKNSPAYQNGSAPMNAPKHTANGWVYYTLNRGALKGLSAGVGAYYVGKRPVNEWSLKPDPAHNSMVGDKPFDMPGYTTVNLQLAYAIGPVTARVYFNNLFDEIGYNAYYRGGFINQIDPRNFAAVVSYRF